MRYMSCDRSPCAETCDLDQTTNLTSTRELARYSGAQCCRSSCVSDTASATPKLGGYQPLRQIGF